MEKYSWENLRIEEMEEKADVILLPSHDMDGCRFDIDDPYWDGYMRQEDAYCQSISKRLSARLGF